VRFSQYYIVRMNEGGFVIDYKHFGEKIQKKKCKSDLFYWSIFTLLVVMLWITAIHFIWK